MENRDTLFKCKSGSHLYGTNTPESDEDFVSVFMPKAVDVLGLQKMEYADESTKSSSDNRRNTKEDVDSINYSLPRYIHLLLHGNPNLTETLFARKDVIIESSSIYDEILSMRNDIISNRVLHSFSGFAYAQFKKLTTKSNRYTSLEKGLKFIESKYAEYIKENKVYPLTQKEGEELSRIVEYYKGQKNNVEPFHKGMGIRMIYEKIKHEYENYGWRVKTDTFLELGIDCKFASHAIRLYVEGTELMKTGKIEYPLKEKDLILDIKYGKYDLKAITELYNEYENKAKEAAKISILRKAPDFNKVNGWLIKTLKEAISKEE